MDTAKKTVRELFRRNHLLKYLLPVFLIATITFATVQLYAGATDQPEKINQTAIIDGMPIVVDASDTPLTVSLQPTSSATAKVRATATATSNTPSTTDTSSPTNPTPQSGTTPTPTSESLSAFIAYYADSQSDTDAEDDNHQRVVDYIMGTSASTVFHAGDLMEDGTQASLDRFNAVTNTMRLTKAFYSAQGNNERNSSLYFDNFTYPGNEHWYSVNIGNLHMIILDNYASSVAIGSEQYNWLLSDLQSAEAQSRMVGVMFHYPIYGAGGDYKSMIGPMVPLFQNYGVDFVFSGHEHSYQKALVNGIYYFVTSGQTAIGYSTAKIYSTYIDFNSYNYLNQLIETVRINNR